MNKSVILFHLTEVAQQLTETIEGIKNDPEYEIGTYTADMSHVYHHLNTAWNGRNCTNDEHRASARFDELRKFPSNSELLLD